METEKRLDDCFSVIRAIHNPYDKPFEETKHTCAYVYFDATLEELAEMYPTIEWVQCYTVLPEHKNSFIYDTDFIGEYHNRASMRVNIETMFYGMNKIIDEKQGTEEWIQAYESTRAMLRELKVLNNTALNIEVVNMGITLDLKEQQEKETAMQQETLLPVIPMDTQHSLWNHPIIELFKHRATFQTQNGRGSWNYENKERFGSDSYLPKITAKTMVCSHCGKNSAYTVFSYGTMIYESCSACNHSHCNTQYYTKQTSWLQNALSDCFTDFHTAYEQYLTEVRTARKWLTTKRREKYGYSGILDNETVLHAYNEYSGINDNDIHFDVHASNSN